MKLLLKLGGATLLISLGCIVLMSCNGKDEAQPYSDLPRTEVPSEIAGKWLRGNFSMDQFFTYDGKALGNSYESSQAFEFTKDGYAKFYQYITQFDGSCRSHAFTYVEGTVSFENSNFRFHAGKGAYRGAYNGCAQTEFNRPATNDELRNLEHNLQFYWELGQNDNNSNDNKTYFKLWFQSNPNGLPSYFSRVTW